MLDLFCDRNCFIFFYTTRDNFDCAQFLTAFELTEMRHVLSVKEIFWTVLQIYVERDQCDRATVMFTRTGGRFWWYSMMVCFDGAQIVFQVCAQPTLLYRLSFFNFFQTDIALDFAIICLISIYDNSGRFQSIVISWLSNFVHLVINTYIWLRTQSHNFQKLNYLKNRTVWFMEKN